MTITSATFSMSANAQASNTTSTIEQTTTAVADKTSWTASVGTGANSADVAYSKSGTIGTSATVTIDLSALTDAFGNSITLARVKAFKITNKGTDATNIMTVGGNVANAFEGWISTGGTVDIRPATSTNDAAFAIQAPDATGYVVGTDVNLDLENTSATVTMDYEISIIGASA